MGDELDSFGEFWNPLQLRLIEQELLALQPYVILSGGWAWHFLTPAGHVEHKHAHDHQATELFVAPSYVGPLLALLSARGYERTSPHGDRLASDAEFTRYTRVITSDRGTLQLALDLLVADVPHVAARGFRVAEPTFLLSRLAAEPRGEPCFAMQIARELVARGEEIVGHPAMADYQRFLN